MTGTVIHSFQSTGVEAEKLTLVLGYIVVVYPCPIPSPCQRHYDLRIWEQRCSCRIHCGPLVGIRAWNKYVRLNNNSSFALQLHYDFNSTPMTHKTEFSTKINYMKQKSFNVFFKQHVPLVNLQKSLHPSQGASSMYFQSSALPLFAVLVELNFRHTWLHELNLWIN